MKFELTPSLASKLASVVVHALANAVHDPEWVASLGPLAPKKRCLDDLKARAHGKKGKSNGKK